jgi:hypothetical protein
VKKICSVIRSELILKPVRLKEEWKGMKLDQNTWLRAEPIQFRRLESSTSSSP